MAPAPLHESKILKPKDPGLVDDNDWPDFLLTNVEITDSESGELTSLLDAAADTPLTLVGKLPKFSDRSQLKSLINSKAVKLLPATIQVTDIQHYCYGQNDDGEAIMWAAGEAGWFQVKPSRNYSSIHKRSCEAVNILYFLSDFYRDLKGKKLKTTPVETVFQEYMRDPSHHCSDEEQAESLFLKHKKFLFHCMEKGKEGVNWKNTTIYEWLSREDPETSSETESAVQTPPPIDISDSDQPTARRAGKSKSSLRPKSNKQSLKSMGRRRSIGEDGANDTPTIAAATLKRKASSRGPGRPRKRGGTSDGMQDAEMQSASESDSSETSPTEPSLPLNANAKRSATTTKHEPIFQIIEEPLPSFEPQGPGDTWFCTFDGCSYTVYGAKKAANRELIKDHYKTHALQKQAQLDLVYTEERPYLPVNNLIKRIREMAAVHKPVPSPSPAAGAAEEFPKPIVRKY